MIVPGVLNVLYIFLFRQFISQIPDAFLEAAKIDGANHFGIFTKIVYPMMLPVIATTIVMEATARWNDLFTPLMYLKSEEMFTLQLGLFRFQDNMDMSRLGERWVATALVTIPMVLVYIAFQKYFIKAFSSTGLK
jgi:multiple sugar transport system permease protein